VERVGGKIWDDGKILRVIFKVRCASIALTPCPSPLAKSAPGEGSFLSFALSTPKMLGRGELSKFRLLNSKNARERGAF